MRPQTAAPRVICAGHVNWDVTLQVDALPEPDGEARIERQSRSGGGSAANVAAALAGLDVSAGLVGSVGDDEPGLLARRELDGLDVDLSHLQVVSDAETSVKYLIVAGGGEVMVLGNDGANEAVAPGDVDPDYVGRAEHLHLTSQRPDTAARLAAVARDAGLTVSFDPGRRLGSRDFSAALDRANVVFVNDREAETVLDRRYDEPIPPRDDAVLVVKHGGDGAVVRTAEATYRHPGFEVDPVDTTGAGDAFAAGFLSVLLVDGDYERALEFANACGALTARQRGARSAPSGEAVAAFLAEQYA